MLDRFAGKDPLRWVAVGILFLQALLIVEGTWVFASMALAYAEFEGQPAPDMGGGVVANIVSGILFFLAAVSLVRTGLVQSGRRAVLLFAVVALEVTWAALLVRGWSERARPFENLLWDVVQIAASLVVTAVLGAALLRLPKARFMGQSPG